MAQFKITSEPTFNGGSPRPGVFSIGEIVDVIDPEDVDEDGDVHAIGPQTDGRTRWVSLSCLTPIDEVPTAKATAGEVTVKVTPDLDDFAALLVAKIADSLEEAAKAIRGAAS